MSDVRWEGYSHDEIYARVQQGPGRLASADAEAAWSTVEGTEERPPRTAGEIVTDDGGSGAEALVGFLASKKFI